MPAISPMTPIDPRVEMFQKGIPQDTFFNMTALAPRPVSNATEMFDTEFEDDLSEIEDNSPRLSVNSAGQRSQTTLSSFDEIHTPSPTSNAFHGFSFEILPKQPVEGPRGPHLFRTSVDSSVGSQEDQYVLAMSPMTPRPSSTQRAFMIADAPRVPEVPGRQRLTLRTNINENLNLNLVSSWTPGQVARWMDDAGLEPTIVEKFLENDISGAILMTLKFEDLRELDIPSFGQRTKVWNEIHILRGSPPTTPEAATPIEEVASPCIDCKRPSRATSMRERSRDCGSDEETRRHRSKRRHRKRDDVITPLESVSIVGIEQLIPKPHKCSKGENCSKWRKQHRLIDTFNKEHPVSPDGGSVWVAGDPGNPLTAEPIMDATRPFSGPTRPISDAVPSVVASSDVLGPGSIPAFRHLEEASLRNVQSRDPQDNVKQFIRFQHMDPSQMAWSSEEPATPPFEMFPTLPAPHTGLRGLPKLNIPPPRPAPAPRSASANAFSPYRMERVEAMSPELRNATQSPSTVYRFGTPFSDMDMPVTAIPVGPVSRGVTQSVPPNMSYRHAPAPAAPLQRTQSRASARRPSFPAMPRVDEHISTALPTQAKFQPHQIQQPNRGYNNYFSSDSWSPLKEPYNRSVDDITYAGLMKKRKTKMLRHEWHEHHFTLKGTRLSMHKDARALETLEYIDVDDYAIACSSLASGKLNAAFKAMNISRGANKKDEGAFSFQLIPAALEKGARLRKRESAMVANGSSSEGKDGGAKGKTHHFAVKSRDERIDWMRELMLAKALKQKSEGYEVNVNGNMI